MLKYRNTYHFQIITGDKGNGWIRGEFPLTKISRNFQIVFEGIRGTGYQGDIAIDDVKFRTDSCARKSSGKADKPI